MKPSVSTSVRRAGGAPESSWTVTNTAAAAAAADAVEDQSSLLPPSWRLREGRFCVLVDGGGSSSEGGHSGCFYATGTFTESSTQLRLANNPVLWRLGQFRLLIQASIQFHFEVLRKRALFLTVERRGSEQAARHLVESLVCWGFEMGVETQDFYTLKLE